jgi:hypothetical protein
MQSGRRHQRSAPLPSQLVSQSHQLVVSTDEAANRRGNVPEAFTPSGKRRPQLPDVMSRRVEFDERLVQQHLQLIRVTESPHSQTAISQPSTELLLPILILGVKQAVPGKRNIGVFIQQKQEPRYSYLPRHGKLQLGVGQLRTITNR